MTGDELLAKLHAMTPEQRTKEVLIEGEDKFRNTIYFATKDVRVSLVNDNAKEVYDEDEDGTECILIGRF